MSWKAMLRVLPPTFKPVLQEIRLLQVAKSWLLRFNKKSVVTQVASTFIFARQAWTSGRPFDFWGGWGNRCFGLGKKFFRQTPVIEFFPRLYAMKGIFFPCRKLPSKLVCRIFFFLNSPLPPFRVKYSVPNTRYIALQQCCKTSCAFLFPISP